MGLSRACLEGVREVRGREEDGGTLLRWSGSRTACANKAAAVILEQSADRPTQRGHIVNLSSVAGMEAYAGAGLGCCSQCVDGSLLCRCGGC